MKSPVGNAFGQNAVVESYVLHSRVLADFLSNRGGTDRVRATDFLPNFEIDDPIASWRDQVNAHAAHLLWTRVGEDPHWLPMHKPVLACFSDFLTTLEEQQPNLATEIRQHLH